MHTRSPILILLVALGLLLGCSGGESPGASESGDRQSGTSKGSLAPDFALPRIAEPGRLKLSDQRGKVVLVVFWASWCGPCRVEMPALDKAWLQYKGKDVVFLGISVDDDPLSAERFLQEVPIGFPSLIDTSGHVSGGEWRVSSLPTTVVLDRGGVVRSRHLGYTPRQLQQSLNLIDDLLEEPVP